MKKPSVKRIPYAAAPPEKDIIFCISLYFSIPPVFSRQNFLFKNYLNEIAKKRNILEAIADPEEKQIFKTYLTTRIPKVKISLDATNKHYSGVYLINKNLQILVSGIMADFKAGMLKVKFYKKPLTELQMEKKINDFCDKRGLPKKYPVSNKPLDEIVKEWKQKNADIDNQKTHTGSKK